MVEDQLVLEKAKAGRYEFFRMQFSHQYLFKFIFSKK